MQFAIQSELILSFSRYLTFQIMMMAGLTMILTEW